MELIENLLVPEQIIEQATKVGWISEVTAKVYEEYCRENIFPPHMFCDLLGVLE